MPKIPFKQSLLRCGAHIKGINLTELLVVLIIIVILVGLSIPSFTKTKQAALDRDAQVALRLIQAAERIYYIKQGTYYPNFDAGVFTANIGDLNSYLRLALTDEHWDYNISTGSTQEYTVTASQAGDPKWRIRHDDTDAQACP